MFNAYKYIEAYYGEHIIDEYEEVYGLNGRDLLLSCDSEEEVDSLLDN